MSERNPQWQLATILPTRLYRPDSVVSGVPVRVYVPGSAHLAFSGVPHPQPAQQALVILHRLTQIAPRARPGLDTVGTFVMRDSLDLLPLRDTLRIHP